MVRGEGGVRPRDVVGMVLLGLSCGMVMETIELKDCCQFTEGQSL